MTDILWKKTEPELILQLFKILSSHNIPYDPLGTIRIDDDDDRDDDSNTLRLFLYLCT